jgi:membrane protein YdbS with pleckstrin-like domain
LGEAIVGERIRRILLRVLRVPAPPEPPAGDPGPVRVFRAGRNFFRYNVVKWVLAQLGALWGLLFGLLMFRFRGWSDHPGALRVFEVVEISAWVLFVLQLPVTFLLLRLDYEYRWYLVTGRSLRVREGLLGIHEQTMTFANVQQISIRQGPLQRLLGIADLEVRAAGGGGSEVAGSGSSRGSGHVASFRGVDDATAIRDLVRERVRTHRDAGLGNPDDPSTAAPPGSGRVAAAGAVLQEVRDLRRALTSRTIP